MNDGHNDYTDDWDCAPPRDDGWMNEYVKQHLDNEQHRVSWDERHKKIASASRKVRIGLAAGPQE